MIRHVINIETEGSVKAYTLYLNYKRIKNVIFRVKEGEENAFLVSLPFGTRLSELEKLFVKSYGRLLKLETKVKPVPFNEFTYVFGEKVEVASLKERFNLKKDVTNLDAFYTAMRKVLLTFLKEEVEFYALKMKITIPYLVRTRKMKTRWGTNSRHTLTLTFNEKLIHFHKDIIKALVVHELAHHYISGHGPDFYEYLETIIPLYKHYDKLLKEHKYDGHY